MTQTWKQERPSWCPHPTCIFKRRAMDDICGGQLPEPEPHDGDFNTMRFCLNGADSTGAVFDLQVNDSDLHWIRWVFDGMQGRQARTQEPSDVALPCSECSHEHGFADVCARWIGEGEQCRCDGRQSQGGQLGR